MKNKKKIIELITIITLLIILILIGVLIIKKTQELAKKSEIQAPEEVKNLYTGKVNCTIDISKDNTNQTYILDVLDIKEGIVNYRNYFYKIVYLDQDNYEGFKLNEKVKNPEYDDANLTIIYEREEKKDLSKDHRKYQEFINELEQDGYTCQEESK